MTSEREDVQCRDIRDDSGPERVEMDVCDQLFEISVLLAKDRFISVLPPAPLPGRRVEPTARREKDVRIG